MEFKNIEFLWGFLALLPLLFLIRSDRFELEKYFDKRVLEKIYIKNRGLSKQFRSILFLLSIAFALIAFARPYIDNGEIKVNSNDMELMVGFDISNSMFCDDIYPNRFEFSKRKFYQALKSLKSARVGVIGFSSRAFLISPLTKDFESLKYLVKNMNLDFVSLKGTSIMSALEVTNRLLKDQKQKALLLFTDGGDKKSYQKEIAYAKEHHIKLFIYAVGTKKGGVIKTKDGVLKDKNGDIVIVRRNDAIKELALKSGGAYMKYSLKKDDIKALIDDIEHKFKKNSKKSRVIKDTKELFIYPLMLSILFFIISLSSLPRRER